MNPCPPMTVQVETRAPDDMSEFDWIAVDAESQTVVLKVNGSRAELLRQLLDEFPEGRYGVMRVEAVEVFKITVTRVAVPVR